MMEVNGKEKENKIKWEDLLSKEDMDLARTLVDKVDNRVGLIIQRASNEQYLNIEPKKDPYRMSLAHGGDTEVVVETDGQKKTTGSTITSANERVLSIVVTGYKYILTQYRKNNIVVSQNIVFADIKLSRYFEALRASIRLG